MARHPLPHLLLLLRLLVLRWRCPRLPWCLPSPQVLFLHWLLVPQLQLQLQRLLQPQPQLQLLFVFCFLSDRVSVIFLPDTMHKQAAQFPEETIRSLMEIGMSREQAIQSLVAANGNFELAASLWFQ